MNDKVLEQIVDGSPTLQQMFAEWARNDLRRAADAARADPLAHKKATVFDGPLRWRFWEARDCRGRRVRFCYSTTRNAAGYFLTWRETVNANGSGKRTEFSASKTRAVVKQRARDRHTSFIATREQP